MATAIPVGMESLTHALATQKAEFAINPLGEIVIIVLLFIILKFLLGYFAAKAAYDNGNYPIRYSIGDDPGSAIGQAESEIEDLREQVNGITTTQANFGTIEEGKLEKLLPGQR